MSNVSDVSRLITKINNASNEIARLKNSMKQEADGVSWWWKGDAATTFRQTYSSIDSDIVRLNYKISELRTRTKELLRLLEEEEREKKAASKIR